MVSPEGRWLCTDLVITQCRVEVCGVAKLVADGGSRVSSGLGCFCSLLPPLGSCSLFPPTSVVHHRSRETGPCPQARLLGICVSGPSALLDCTRSRAQLANRGAGAVGRKPVQRCLDTQLSVARHAPQIMLLSSRGQGIAARRISRPDSLPFSTEQRYNNLRRHLKV